MIDLHTHSTVSDGSEAPERVVELAAGAGLSAVALTDHDRLDGIGPAARRAGEVGVDLVAGCELSCEHPATMHVLVYFLGPGGGAGDGPLERELVRLQRARDTRNQRMATLLGELGLPVTYAEIEEEAGGIGAGRPHVASILVRKGVVGSVQEAFDTWLAKGRPGYMDKERLDAATALRLARDSGATPVLAHPLSLELEGPRLESAVRELADLGLVGVEAIYGRYSGEERTEISDLAKRCGLVVTGGSDYHGTYKPDLEVGTGRGDLAVPDTVLDDLREHAGG
ncbi:MAG TPA: PHP domain-containing protein [Acidimicrobiales bacterium]|nr:PHP domain-containing protein [Acidimicrobiales bacterium]